MVQPLFFLFVVYPSSPYLPNLDTMMLWDTLAKAYTLLKQMSFTALPGASRLLREGISMGMVQFALIRPMLLVPNHLLGLYVSWGGFAP